ncbi:MAG: hypothetical protein AAFV85_23150 [Cyanobacteria bacterium J06634_6]
MTTSAYKPKAGSAAVAFAVFSTLTMGVMLLLNLQPWFVLGKDVTAQIDTGPLLGVADWLVGGQIAIALGIVFLIAAVRFSKRRKLISAQLVICGFILLLDPGTLIRALGEIVGFLMWGWIQFIQVSPMLAQHSLIPANGQWIVQLKQYRAAAYFFEAVACFVKYPPYANGDINRLMNDLSSFSLSASQWNWINFFWAVVVMMCVEMTFKFLLKAGVYSGAFSKKATAQPDTSTSKKGYKVYNQ